MNQNMLKKLETFRYLWKVGAPLAAERAVLSSAQVLLIRQPQANGLRINSGTPEENAACVDALTAVLKELEA